MKKFTFPTFPVVCSNSIDIEINDDYCISFVRFNGGCPGSLTAVAALTKNKTPQEAIKILDGISCGGKRTSCPDQLAQALKKVCKQLNLK